MSTPVWSWTLAWRASRPRGRSHSKAAFKRLLLVMRDIQYGQVQDQEGAFAHSLKLLTIVSTVVRGRLDTS